MAKTVHTPIQDLLKIQHPVLLAGMGNVATAKLVAAVSNAGGLGVLGGISFTPQKLREEIREVKSMLNDKTAFGVDLLLPQVGGNARKTNYDYTKGKLPELVDIIIEEKARLFVSAVGIPPKWLVDKFHAAGILVANMCGHPKHVQKALDVGCDMMVAQGYEAGGHTGDVGSMALFPQVLDAVKGRTSPLTGGPVHVIAAGGIYDGRTAASVLAMGCVGVWVGTRFVATPEATASKPHKANLVKAGPTDAVRTLFYTGRPLRTYDTELVHDWNGPRRQEMEDMCARGVLPGNTFFKEYRGNMKGLKEKYPTMNMVTALPMLMGQCAGGIHEIIPAQKVIENMMAGAVEILEGTAKMVRPVAKL
eukprot:Hpha_TRINITY_DN14869_c5_g10::TRINITY_DN14869_c5_g10_i1::g.169619::m.169619